MNLYKRKGEIVIFRRVKEETFLLDAETSSDKYGVAKTFITNGLCSFSTVYKDIDFYTAQELKEIHNAQNIDPNTKYVLEIKSNGEKMYLDLY